MIVENTDSSPVIVNDKRKSYASDAEIVTPVVEGEIVVAEGHVIDAGPVAPPVPPVETPVDDKKKPHNGPPSLFVPSAIPGADMIKFTVTEFLPWKGVFFMVVDVKDAENGKPPHIILIPMDHTKAHKKLALKAIQKAPRKKRVGGAPKLVLVPPTKPEDNTVA